MPQSFSRHGSWPNSATVWINASIDKLPVDSKLKEAVKKAYDKLTKSKEDKDQ